MLNASGKALPVILASSTCRTSEGLILRNPIPVAMTMTVASVTASREMRTTGLTIISYFVLRFVSKGRNPLTAAVVFPFVFSWARMVEMEKMKRKKVCIR